MERVIHGDDDDDDANDNEHDAVVRRGAFEDGNAADSVSSSHRKVPESSINRPRWASDDGTRYSSPTHEQNQSIPEQPSADSKASCDSGAVKLSSSADERRSSWFQGIFRSKKDKEKEANMGKKLEAYFKSGDPQHQPDHAMAA